VLDRADGLFALSLKPTPYACVAASKVAVLSGGSTSQQATTQETSTDTPPSLPDRKSDENVSVSTGSPGNSGILPEIELKGDVGVTIGSYRLRCVLSDVDKRRDRSFIESEVMETELSDWISVIGHNASDYSINFGASTTERDGVAVRVCDMPTVLDVCLNKPHNTGISRWQRVFRVGSEGVGLRKERDSYQYYISCSYSANGFDINTPSCTADWSLNPELYLDREYDAYTGSIGMFKPPMYTNSPLKVMDDT